MTITKSVIVDLWAIYASGEASADTRALVEDYLRGDPELAQQLRHEPALPAPAAPLSPDHQARALALTRRRLRGLPLLLFLAMMLSMMAFGRIVADTSWDVSPRSFIVVASMAGACWIAYFVSLWRMRARILIVPSARGGRG
jgi:ferric-dicitrate binding protein FerR (iron transport regulator)